MPRKNQSTFDLLLRAPWWVAVLLAGLVYLVMAIILPSLNTENPALKTVFNSLAIPAPYFALIILLAAPFSFLNARRKARQLDQQQDLNSIRQLHWRNFEELVAEAYRRQGYRVVEGDYGADGGIDLQLSKNGDITLVQCKQWRVQKVGVSVVREMFGVLTASHAAKVVIICSGYFTQESTAFSHNKPIELIDGHSLLALIRGVQPSASVEAGEKPQCPRCGQALTERTAKRGQHAGQRFWGCSGFPQCRYTQELNKDVL